MFCPQCGHQQISDETRFCSRCGLPLGLVTELLDKSGEQLLRERREIRGIGLTMATVLMLTNFIIVFGAVTLPHLANRVFLIIWAFFVVSALVTGGLGLANLIRGGFFKRLKEREARLHLMKSEEGRRALPEGAAAATASLGVEATARVPEPVSVTETTTRELR